MKALRDVVQQERFTFNVTLYDTITELEKKIVLEEFHFYRGDVSDYLIRSTQSRVKYKKKNSSLRILHQFEEAIF